MTERKFSPMVKLNINSLYVFINCSGLVVALAFQIQNFAILSDVSKSGLAISRESVFENMETGFSS